MMAGSWCVFHGKACSSSIWHLASSIRHLPSCILHLASGSQVTKTKCGKEKCMTNNNDNRVLGRRNARQLTAEELHKILGQGNTQMTQLPSMPFHPDF